MCNEIKVGNFIATQDEKGDWIYKADNQNQFKKKDGSLKAQYKDMPRFDLIIQLEKKTTDMYEQTLTQSINQVAKQIKNIKIYE
jgi:hypothetical protein